MRKNFLLLSIGVVLIIVLASGGFSGGFQTSASTIGRIAPDFSLKGIDGGTVKLKSVIGKNKVTILNFWATWCPPCRAEIPEFIEFAKENKSSKVAVVAVNIQEDPNKVKEFAKTNQMNFPVLLDTGGKVAQTYQIYAIPTTFFIDSSGTIREKVEGSLSRSRLESIYRKLAK